MRHTATHLNAIGHRATERLQVVVQRELVERQRLNQHITSRVRQVDEVKVALQDTVLARGAMDGDVGVVKTHFLSLVHKREVVTVDGGSSALRKIHMPVLESQNGNKHVVTVLIKGFIEALSGAQGHLVL